MTANVLRFPFLSVAALTLALAASPVLGAAGETGESDDAAAKRYQEIMRTGTLNNNMGRFRTAEKAFREALDVCEGLRGASHPDCADALIRLGLEISNQRRFEEAELVFRRAEALSAAAPSPLAVPRYQTYRAMDLGNRQRFEEAFALVLQANQRRKGLIQTDVAKAARARPGAKRRLERAMADLAHGLFVQASLAYRRGRLDEARVSAHLARRLILGIKDLPDWWTANIDELLANIDLQRNDTVAAEKRLQLALATKRLALGNTRALAATHFILGSVYREGRRDAEAVKTMRPGFAIVSSELGEGAGVDFRRIHPFLVSAFEEARRDAARRAALHAEMFAASQLIRAGGAARAVAQVAARFASATPRVAELVRRSQEATIERDRLRIALGRLSVSRGAKDRKKRLATLRDAFAEAARNSAALDQELATAFPDYARLISAAPVSAADLGALLGADEAVLHLVLGDGGGFGFLIRADGLSVARLEIDEEQAAVAVRHLRAPFDRQEGGRVAPFDMAAAHALYGKILGPFESRLQGLGHLIVVPSGALMSLPFALLVTAPPSALAANDYGGAAWLARRMATTQAPSVRAFADLRRVARPSAAPKPFIGFGNPVFSGTAGGGGMAALAGHCRAGAPVPAALLRGLAPLPGTAREVRDVARALDAGPDSVFLGARATERRLKRLALDQYRIVYFATHGLLPGELRCQSEPALALTPPEPGAPGAGGDDGLLGASEIAALRLDAELVVLSACNTGGGGSGRFGGEALSGLVRAFFQAGARSMIVSHWQVDSEATARLMSGVFDRLSRDPAAGPSRALRRARVGLIGRAETAHPFFWAAFSLIGTGAPGATVRQAARAG